MRKLAVLASGSGTNLQAIINATLSGALPGVSVAVVVSNRRRAYALQRAANHNIPTIYHPLKPYRDKGLSRAQYDADLADKLESYKVDLIVLAGWMHLFTMDFLKRYSQRVINIHPALPGTFPGMHGIQEAWDAYQAGDITETGVMVHYVPDEAVDDGPVIAQRIVEILPDDTVETLEERIHSVEYQLYVEAIKLALAEID